MSASLFVSTSSGFRCIIYDDDGAPFTCLALALGIDGSLDLPQNSGDVYLQVPGGSSIRDMLRDASLQDKNQ